jgi:hypothetical protein
MFLALHKLINHGQQMFLYLYLPTFLSCQVTTLKPRQLNNYKLRMFQLRDQKGNRRMRFFEYSNRIYELTGNRELLDDYTFQFQYYT